MSQIEEDVRLKNLESELKRMTTLSEMLGETLARRTDQFEKVVDFYEDKLKRGEAHAARQREM